MIAYIRAGGKGAAGQASAGQEQSALSTPAAAYAAPALGYRLSTARFGERQLLDYLCAALSPAFSRQLITSYYVSLKTNPFVVLTGREGAGKAALAAGLAGALTGPDSDQFITIGSNSWAQHSGQSSYYSDLHTQFGSLHFLEMLHDAAAPANMGKLYMVLLKGLTLEELDYYFNRLLWVNRRGEKRLALPGLTIDQQPVLPPNILITATLHIPRRASADDRRVLRSAGQITFPGDLHDAPPLAVPALPPVGLQRIMLGAARHDPAEAQERLQGILGRRELRRLGPSAALARRLHDGGLAVHQLAEKILAYVANSFDQSGRGLFDPDDVRRNAQIAYDDQVIQRSLAQIAAPRGRLRRGRLARQAPAIA